MRSKKLSGKCHHETFHFPISRHNSPKIQICLQATENTTKQRATAMKRERGEEHFATQTTPSPWIKRQRTDKESSAPVAESAILILSDDDEEEITQDDMSGHKKQCEQEQVKEQVKEEEQEEKHLTIQKLFGDGPSHFVDLTIQEKSTQKCHVFHIDVNRVTQLELKKLVFAHFNPRERVVEASTHSSQSNQFISHAVRLVFRGNFLLRDHDLLRELLIPFHEKDTSGIAAPPKMFLLWNMKSALFNGESKVFKNSVRNVNEKVHKNDNENDHDNDVICIDDDDDDDDNNCGGGGDDDNDYDGLELKRAIELSLLQNENGSNSSASGSSSGSSHSNLKHEERTRTSTNTPNSDHHRFRFNGEKIYLNRLIESKIRTSNSDVLSIEEIVEKDRLESAFISTFSFELEYMATVFDLRNKMIPITLVKHWEKSGEQEGRSMFQVGQSPMAVVHPPLPHRYSNMHSKLWLLSFPDCLRVVVSSANMCYHDWHSYTQVIWIQDFPKRRSSSTGPANNSSNTVATTTTDCHFRDELINFWNISTLGIPSKWIDQYDFSGAKAHLVTSVPGYHSGLDLNRYGHMRIRSLLKRNVFSTPLEKQPLSSCYFQASSIGALDMRWLEEVGASCFIHVPETRARNGLKIVFPSESTVKQSKLGTRGAGMIILRKDTYLSPKFPKHLLCDYNSNQYSQDGHLAHSKIFVHCDSSHTAQWIYVGSHNFSGAALGRLQKKGTQLCCSNYEVGIVLLKDLSQANTCHLPFKIPVDPYDANTVPHLLDCE